MVLLKLLIFTLIFNELIVYLDARSCPKGQKVTRQNGCKDCSDGSYQPEENISQLCRACTRCDPNSGSEEIQSCTKERNTKCRCRGEFSPSDSDFSTCKCDIGFGLNHGECSKCEEGYFSTEINTPCRKWTDCKSAGVKIYGTTTSDVICNEEMKSNTSVSTTPTSNKIVSLITHLTSRRPQEGTQTQKTHTTITTTSTPGYTVTQKNIVQSYPSNTGILLIFGIVGLLVLTAVICKLHIIPCMERHPTVKKNESLCRRPVEESGDGSMSSLKLNPVN